MATGVDWGLAFQNTPVTATERSLTHLGSILDAVMQRRQNEELARAKMAQEASQFAINQKREQQLADQAVRHQQAEEAQARAALEQKDRQEVRSGIQGVLPAVKTAIQGGDIPGANLAGSQWGVKVAPVMAPAPTDDQALGPKVPDVTAASQTSANPLDVMQATMARVRAEQLKAEAAGPQPTGQYNIQAGDQTIAYDPEAEKRHQMQEGQEASSELASIAGGGQFDAQAQGDVQRLVASGKLAPKDAAKTYVDLKKAYEDRDERLKAALLAAEAQRARTENTHPPGERAVATYEGAPAGLAATKEDAEKARAKRAAIRPIIEKLDAMKAAVGQMGWQERVPIVGQHTNAQQAFKSDLNQMIAQITQATGSGTPQEGEARRQLEALTVSLTQGPEIAQRNIDSLKQYLRNMYEQEVGSVVPGYTPKRPSSPAEDPATQLWRELNGK